MSPVDADHFTDMDGNGIEEDSPEPLPSPFCGGGGDQLVVERWSEEAGQGLIGGFRHAGCVR